MFKLNRGRRVSPVTIAGLLLKSIFVKSSGKPRWGGILTVAVLAVVGIFGFNLFGSQQGTQLAQTSKTLTASDTTPRNVVVTFKKTSDAFHSLDRREDELDYTGKLELTVPEANFESDMAANGLTAEEQALDKTLENFGITNIEVSTKLDGIYDLIGGSSTDAQKLVEALKANPLVQDAYVDEVVTTEKLPNDPMYNQQYALSKMDLAKAWDVTTGSNDVVVAVLDTGVQSNHPELTGRVLKGYNFVNNTEDTEDWGRHGTMVSGTIAANTNDGVGIAGTMWQGKILPVTVMSSSGSGTHYGIAAGIRYAADKGVQIINMSLGGGSDSAVMRDAITYALGKGVIVVASAGNGGSSSPSYPAATPGVIAVGASDKNDNVASFSSYGSHVTIVAPGAEILTSDMGSKYATVNGTSFSSPYTAGVIGLLLSANPKLNAKQVKAILEQTADKLSDSRAGKGRVNAAKAVALAANPDGTIRALATNNSACPYMNGGM